ncbi:Glycosyl transferase family 2 [Alkalibacterium subtropicum]|uniref:Glycosyl transferase family 2 n=1 Tax=Alkalibacterium subtropicum TaxID=753702 RepID=A0A1I1GEN6_9LACT|nr:glycosyltransferase [Alkalibacterium subtropicum]SFC09742.1 Glycosyl transferase family 2 [Alkalibacterium subtropicum]
MSVQVSVSVTTYNQERYIEQTLDSILMQKTDFDYEILINDDASTDKSTDIIRKYEKAYPDIIKPIYQTVNQYSQKKEVHYTFNYTRAQGKYIAYCDGDDYWTDADKLQKQFDYMEAHPHISACVHAGKSVNEQATRILGTQRVDQSNCYLNTEKVIALQGKFASNSLFMKNYFTGDFSMPAWFNEANITDYPLYLILSTKGDLYYLNDVMCAFRVGSKGSFTQLVLNDAGKRKKHIYEMIDLLESFDEYTDREYADVIQNQIKHNQLDYLMVDHTMKNTDPEGFRRLYDSLPLRRKIKLNMLMYLPAGVVLYKRLKSSALSTAFKPKETFRIHNRQEV